MGNLEPRVATPGPDVTQNLVSSNVLVREQAKATILSATKEAGGSQQQAEQLISTLVSNNIVACQGGGVSSKTSRHGADKTRSQKPFSPLEKVTHLTKLTNYCYTKLSDTTGYFTKAG